MAARKDKFGGIGDNSEVWIRNRQFLDQGIRKGSTFRLASDPLDPLNNPSFFLREVEYLQSQGFSISPDRALMLPPS